MSVSNDSINCRPVIDLMILDEHDAVFNPIHAKALVNTAWTTIALIVAVAITATYFIAAPAFELYTQSVPGASNAMMSLIIAGFVAIFAIDLVAGYITRHSAGSRLVKITVG